MIKKYIYNMAAPFTGIDTVGAMYKLHEGDIVYAYADGLYECYDHRFALTKEILKREFRRVYTTEEQMRYDRIYEHAVVGAMQSLIARFDDTISSDMHELENITSNAIWFADDLLKKLKDKEY